MCFKPKIDTSYQDFQIAEAERARARETERQARIDTGMKTIADVFADLNPVLDQRRKAQEDYYLPQLDKQYSDARDQLTFALANAGQSKSTTAGRKFSDLAEAFALQEGKIQSDIAGDIAGTQTRMNQNRASIEAALRSSGDNTAAADAALRQAVSFRSELPKVSPLAYAFQGATQGIGAAKTGYETGRIQSLSRPRPLNYKSSRNVV